MYVPHYRGVEAAVAIVEHDIFHQHYLHMVFYLRVFVRNKDEPEKIK